nr:hypothetical protein [uncultured Mediterranean phage uvMED]
MTLTRITSDGITDAAIVNADINASAAIAGTKISPDFGSQNITTSGGTITTSHLVVSGNTTLGHGNSTGNQLKFVRSGLGDELVIGTDGYGSSTQYEATIQSSINDSRPLVFRTNNTDRLRIAGGGTVDIAGNLDVGAGVDVTGNITVTGTVDGVDVAALSTSNAAKMPLTGGTFTGNVTTQKILPVNDSQFDIGENATRFANVYADTLYGDGSNLTGITSTTISNNADNRVITGGSGTNLNGESGLTFDGTNLIMNTSGGRIFSTRTSGEAGLLLGSSNASGATLYLDGDSNGDWSGSDYAYITHSTSGNLEIHSTNPNDDGQIQFYTGANTYYGRITSDGILSLNGAANASAFEINAGTNGGSIVLDRNGNITSLIRASDGGSNVGGGSGGGSRIQLAKTAINFKTYPYVTNVGDAVTYTTRCSIDTSGNFVPGANNSYNLGTSSLRWANVYTNDLHLSNEGHSNDVDGTWGSYTIQEGAEDLFLVNKRNGKKYKFNLTEVN